LSDVNLHNSDLHNATGSDTGGETHSSNAPNVEQAVLTHDVLAYAYGKPRVQGQFKSSCEDFGVIEDLGFELSGAGEHLCVRIRKSGVTTAHVLKVLAEHSGIRERDIGYSGLKDKQGVCEQWFSLYLAQRPDIDLRPIENEQMQILEIARNDRKIRRGSHRANLFQIRLRDLNGELDCLEARLTSIASEGVPNYFGEQRFGFDSNNVSQALAMFRGQLKLRKGFKRGMLLSAARSYVFNAQLSQRVAGGSWNQYLDGDVMNLQGTESVFVPAEWDDTLVQRLGEHDIHPTGALWGKGKHKVSGAAKQLECEVAARHQEICDGLVSFGLEQARRSLRLMVNNLQWRREQDDLLLEFSLPPGAYATTVLREVLIF